MAQHRPRRGGGRASSGGSRASSGGSDPARRLALDVLLAVSQRDAYANLLLPELLAERGLSGRDAALATELAYGTLRRRGSYDAVLAICCDRGLAALDPVVLEVLRLGTHQLLSMRVAAHAAVATSVSLVKQAVGPRPAGFVNAVLRRVATRDWPAWLLIAAPSWAEDPVGHLSVSHSHPRWIVEAMAAALGEPLTGELTETRQVLAADNLRPRVHLCALPGRCEQAELVEAGCEPARWSPFGAYLTEGGNPAALAAVAAGRASVQDEASQLVAVALAGARHMAGGADDRWLDLCAGPGGKARLLAGLARAPRARLLAAELREHRARLVRNGVVEGPPPREEQGAFDHAPAMAEAAGAAAVVVADGTRPAWPQAGFGLVLADVPCSGLGALRRRPEARWRRGPADIGPLADLQRRLLASALAAAEPGGVVGFVTCSPHLAETREVLAGALAASPGTELLDAPALLPQVPDLRCEQPWARCAQFWPHRHGTDALFLALLRRGQAR